MTETSQKDPDKFEKDSEEKKVSEKTREQLLKEREEWIATLPAPDRFRIVYSDREILTDEDNDLKRIRQQIDFLMGVGYFKMDEDKVGTAFFCQMKPEWEPTDEFPLTEEILKKEDSEDEKLMENLVEEALEEN